MGRWTTGKGRGRVAEAAKNLDRVKREDRGRERGTRKKKKIW